MSRFSDLPLDLLPYILDHLSEQEFKSLIHVCKSLYKEVIPFLYQDISFTARNSRVYARELSFILRTLVECPQLANYVTSFRLLGSKHHWNREDPTSERNAWTSNLWGLEGVTILSKAQLFLASNQFYQLVDDGMHGSQTQFRGRSKDALATLVLTRFTQLTTLEIGDGFLVHSLFLPRILKRANYLFPKLGHITFGDKKTGAEKGVTYCDLDLIRPAFYLNTLKTFEWRMSQPWRFEWKRPEPPRNENLTMLHLFRTNIDRTTLGQLLAGTSNLKSFYYEQEILFDSAASWRSSMSQFLELRGLNTALNHVVATLEECKLSLVLGPGSLSPDEISEAGWEFPAIQGTLTVLRAMKKLKTVEVPFIFFLGWSPDSAARLEEVLPLDITHLTLRDDFVSHCPWAVGFNCNKKIGLIGEYVEARSVHAPQLYTLKIRLTAAKSDWLYRVVKALNGIISGSGVTTFSTSMPGTEIYTWQFVKQICTLRKDSVMTSTPFAPPQSSNRVVFFDV
ncbi:hypothetical protein K504DRAFT_500850 [Pleomassaria siparia CBS 279.74]|uniref:F-box domain-containing protein n=1 Tax=Pleomassaria siparia CBS 279.74 TaxID=1314801 RepID=A0A6G1KE60_9PLEO|nr:hypothetical protein K504DRAFT_500850 [Pleomassaria siparia CBS 279.74]